MLLRLASFGDTVLVEGLLSSVLFIEAFPAGK